MKKLVVVFLLAIFTSLVVNGQRSWSVYSCESPKAFAISEQKIIYASCCNLYEAVLNPDTLIWNVLGALPGSGEVQDLGERDGKIFLLRGGTVYLLENNSWHAGPSGDYLGIASAYGRLITWSERELSEYAGNWQYQQFSFVDAVAIGDSNIFVFANCGSADYAVYYGKNICDLSQYFEVSDLRAKEGAVARNEYAFGGEVIGGYAAYYKTYKDASFKYVNVLTEGKILSLTTSAGVIFGAGRLAEKGVVFPLHDLSQLSFFPGEIKKIRGNTRGELAAITDDSLYIHWSSALGLEPIVRKQQPIYGIDVLQNPVLENVVIKALYGTELELFNGEGKKIDAWRINEGDNVIFFPHPSGIYFLANQDGCIKLIKI